MEEPVFYFPFAHMDPGDSFVIPTNYPEIVRRTIVREAKRFGVKVKTSVRVEDGILCVRCWMVSVNERTDA
jgi:hypothetical protein